MLCHDDVDAMFIFFRSLSPLNSFTAKSILAGTKNSRSEEFLLAMHTAHKHLHHDEAVCLSSSIISMAENTPHPRKPMRKGLDEAAVKGFSIKV
jgi:hypothetical protein